MLQRVITASHGSCRMDLSQTTRRLAGAASQRTPHGASHEPADGVAAHLPNIPETRVALLALN
jgi:hypothetical protein